MKKISKIGILILVFMLVCVGSVFAFDRASTNISTDIAVVYDDQQEVERVTLPSTHVSNNEFVNYQIIELTKAQIQAIEDATEGENFDAYQSCVEEIAARYDTDADNFANTPAAQEYENEVESTCLGTLESLYPVYNDSNWLSQDLTGGSIYEIPLSSADRNKSYILWVRAKDTAGNYIYRYHLNLNTDILYGDNEDTTGNSSAPSTTSPSSTKSSVNAPNTLLSKSFLIPFVGIVCLVVGVLVITIMSRKKTSK